MLLTRHRPSLVIAAAVLVLVATGCARRPSITQAAAPPPTAAPVAAAPPAPMPAAPPAPAPVAPPAPAAAAPPAPVATARPAPATFAPDATLLDIHFDFDKSVLRPDAARVLESSAVWLKGNAGHAMLIEGHCDERGTEAYNLALGERRAKAAMDFLVAQGVAAGRMSMVSYGEERPQCREKTEACWSKNRRAHFVVKPR